MVGAAHWCSEAWARHMYLTAHETSCRSTSGSPTATRSARGVSSWLMTPPIGSRLGRTAARTLSWLPWRAASTSSGMRTTALAASSGSPYRCLLAQSGAVRHTLRAGPGGPPGSRSGGGLGDQVCGLVHVFGRGPAAYREPDSGCGAVGWHAHRSEDE